MNLDKRLLWQVKLARFAMGLTVFFSLMSALFVILQARVLSQTIGNVFLGGKTLDEVKPLLVLMSVIILLRAATALGIDRSASSAAVQVKSNLRMMVYRHLMTLGPSISQEEQTGELTAVVLQGVDALETYFSQYIPQLLLSMFIPMMILVVVIPMDLLSGVVLLVTLPLIPIFMVLIANTAEGLTRRQWKALSRMSAFFLDSLQGLTTLKMLNQSLKRVEKITEVSECYRRATLKVLRVTFLSAFVLELVATISTAIITVEIGLRLLYGHLGFEEALFILVIAPEFYIPLRLLGQRFHASISGVTAAQRIFQVLDLNPLSPSVGWKGEIGDQVFEGAFTLAFEGVSYQYPGRGQAALQNVSFLVKSGQRVAMVGLSGAGKSTVAKLLLRLIEPTMGKITINGNPIQIFSADDWRKHIAWVPQQPYLFHDTLVANIRLGKPEATLDETKKAAGQAHLDQFIETLPQRYDTSVGEQGARLSGGQAQRLALARAFIKNSPLLVLDEPTVHLDAVEEESVSASIRQICQGRTSFIIAHRLQTVFDADQIIVFDGGRVVESGSHADLLLRKGFYYRMLQGAGLEIGGEN